MKLFCFAAALDNDWEERKKVKYDRHHSLQSHETGHGLVGRARLNEKKSKGRREMENGKNGKFPVGAVVTDEGDW